MLPVTNLPNPVLLYKLIYISDVKGNSHIQQCYLPSYIHLIYTQVPTNRTAELEFCNSFLTYSVHTK